MKKGKKLLDLFLTFLKFGCFTFGGGWGIVAQMRKEYVTKRKTLTEDDLLDLSTVGRSLPGTMIGNTAMLFGYKEAGILGGLVAIIGMAIPPTVIIILITLIYNAFRSNEWVSYAMMGIRAAVVPIVIYSVYGIVRGAYKYAPCVIVSIVTFSLFYFFNVSCIYLVIFGALIGLIISEYYERREKKNV